MGWVDPRAGTIVARIVGNETNVLDEAAAEIKARARASALAHNRTGSFASSFSTIRTPGESGVIDRAVVNDDPNAVSIECGHVAKNGRVVPGLHALRKAAGG